MKKKRFLLNLFLSIELLSGCAMGMGNRRCDSSPLPPRPEQELCLFTKSGKLACFDGRSNPSSYIREISEKDIVTNKNDYTSQEEWLKIILGNH